MNQNKDQKISLKLNVTAAGLNLNNQSMKSNKPIGGNYNGSVRDSSKSEKSNEDEKDKNNDSSPLGQYQRKKHLNNNQN